jgi:hypothetical protein
LLQNAKNLGEAFKVIHPIGSQKKFAKFLGVNHPISAKVAPGVDSTKNNFLTSK